jgi:hypothetical protein
MPTQTVAVPRFWRRTAGSGCAPSEKVTVAPAVDNVEMMLFENCRNAL